MIPAYTIQEIRDRSTDDIAEIIGRYVQLKRAGNSYKGKCPFHDENTASFSVSPAKGIWKCFGCGAGGDAIEFIMRQTGREFMEVIRELAGEYIIDFPEKTTRPAGPSRSQRREDILPGITDMKARIRRKGYAVLLLEEQAAGAFQDKASAPWISAEMPLTQEQVELLKKYTDICLLRTYRPLNTEPVSQSLQACLRASLDVYILEADTAPHVEKRPGGIIHFPYQQDWLNYLLSHYGATESLKKEIIISLACIEDNLSRSIFTTEFINRWNQKLNQPF